MQFLIRKSREVKSTFSYTVLLTFFCLFFLMQLYELDSDPKRKEFLDDLFSFMQKRGMYKENHAFPAQNYLHLTSHRVFYPLSLRPVQSMPLMHSHQHPAHLSHLHGDVYLYLFHSTAVSSVCIMLNLGCGSHIHMTCVIINVGVLTHVHVMIRPWNC